MTKLILTTFLYSCNAIFISFLFLHSEFSYAYKGDIGYTKLATELGINLPNGSGVGVSQIEADTSGSRGPLYSYMPNISDSRFTGKILTDIPDINSIPSSHATSVGATMYGSVAMATGVTNIHNYLAYSPVATGDTPIYNNWLQANYLYWGSTGFPLVSVDRIANHSWVGSVADSSVLRRLDWVVSRDEFIQVVGSHNSTSFLQSMFGAAFNAIVVGRTDANHSTGLANFDAQYNDNRMGMGSVVPRLSTSSAAGVMSSAGILLIETANAGGPGLSNGFTTNRNGDTIFNAGRSETIKAAVFAGADRVTSNQTTTANITDYRINPAHQANNGMDTRFGAGQLNVYNSYHVIAAGEQDSDEDGTTGQIPAYGFDYDANFGGAQGTNAEASYYFSTGNETSIIRASLVWNIKIQGGSRTFDDTATLYDLDLELHDVTGTPSLVVESNSEQDNSENLWEALQPNRNYLLKVTKKGSTTFNWDYALAWIIENDIDGDKVSDEQDNCVSISNPIQPDMDADGSGDACDSDIDGDGVTNSSDAFPLDATESIDTDNDGIGNNADTDDDNDSLLDVDEDINANGIFDVGETDSLNPDTDGDGYNDGEEVAASSNPLDINSIPASPDGDLNNDGIVNVVDILIAQQILNGQLVPTVEQLAHGDVAPLVSGAPVPDAQFNVGDLVVIMRKAIGMIAF